MEDKVISDDDKKRVKDFYHKIFADRSRDFADIYNEIHDIYDYVCNVIEINKCFRKVVTDLCHCYENVDVSQKLVIDVGCGTGILGVIMAEKKFKHVHGLDLSKGMLDVCEKKNVYTKLLNAPLTPDPTPDIADNTYDAAISSGSFVEGHISMEALRELIRIVKPGGYIVYTLYDPNYTKDYMKVQGEIIKEKLAGLIKMELAPYKREYTQDFKFVYGYYVTWNVL